MLAKYESACTACAEEIAEYISAVNQLLMQMHEESENDFALDLLCLQGLSRQLGRTFGKLEKARYTYLLNQDKQFIGHAYPNVLPLWTKPEVMYENDCPEALMYAGIHSELVLKIKLIINYAERSLMFNELSLLTPVVGDSKFESSMMPPIPALLVPNPNYLSLAKVKAKYKELVPWQ